VFKNYLTVAVRNLLRHKVYSSINIIGLAVGMAACIVILLWVRFNLSFDSFHANADRICWLYENQTFGGMGPRYTSSTMPAMGPALQEEIPEIEAFCRFFLSRFGFAARCEARLCEIKKVFYADSSLFRIFSFPLLEGDPATALQQPNSLVVSRELALRLFGEKDPLGQVVTHEGESYTVTGVLKKLPRNSHLQFEALISFSTLEYSQPWGKNNSWRSSCLFTYLLLRPEASPEEVEQKLPGFLQEHLENNTNDLKLFLMPLKKYRLNWPPTGYGKGMDLKQQLSLFVGLALIALLLACINFINLSTANSGRRAREVGLRKVLGSSSPAIARQFLVESVLLAALALLAAISLVELVLPPLNSRLGPGLEFSYLSYWQLSLFLVASTLAVGLLAGSYPAAVISSFQPSAVLRGDATGGAGRRWLRRALVFAQFVVSLLLITCTLVVYGQWKYMRSKELGLNTSQVICLPKNPEMPARYEAFRHSLIANKAVEAVTATGCPLWLEIWRTPLRYEGDNFRSINDAWQAANLDVDYDFIEFFGLELVAGRGFSRDRPADRQAYVINETLAQKIGWSPQQALGRQVSLVDDQYGPVIGVVKDFHFMSVVNRIEPLALLPSNTRLNSVLVRTGPGSLAPALDHIEKQWQDFFPDKPFEYTFLDQEIDLSYKSFEQQTLIIGSFTLLAVLLACLGLLGLVTQAAESRTKEIGIRKVLGASVKDIVLLLSQEFIWLLCLAILIAWPVAWYVMNRWLENFAYRIEIGWMTFLLGGVIALAIAALTVSFQAVKAATANPVDALRYE